MHFAINRWLPVCSWGHRGPSFTCMEIARKPNDELERLRALEESRLLRTPPEGQFDAIAELAVSIFQVPIGLVSLIGDEIQWLKARSGVCVRETSRDISFCSHAILGQRPMVIPDATLDPRFHDNPMVKGELHVRFYAGAPIVLPGGLAVGTVCAIDRVPREVTAEQVRSLEHLAVLAGALIEHERHAARIEEVLNPLRSFSERARA